MMFSAFVLLATISASLASPVTVNLVGRNNVASRELTNTLSTVTIHESCNATERRQLTKALEDTYEVATVARDYVLAHGLSDPVYQTYFGLADPFSVIGAFENLISGNKDGVLLRCDNIDGNCANEGWAGHWRNENATLETVICPLSYEARRTNEQWCGFGYTVAEGAVAYYFATDLIHRFFHIPTISNNLVGHHADTYAQVLELAEHNATYAPFNTHTLQYFASDVYAREVAVPGIGCTGTVPEEEEHDHDHSSEATAVSSTVAATSDVSATSVAQATTTEVSATTTAASACHTHSDGEVHCE